MNTTETNPELRQISDEKLNDILQAHDKWLLFQARLSVSITGSKEFLDLAEKYPRLEADELIDLVKKDSPHYQSVEEELKEGARADLSHADLSGKQLMDKDLSFANLSGSKLHYTNLENAILRHADLSDSDMTHAMLFNAHLYKTNLSHAYLREVNFHSAYMEKADLRHSDLKNAVFYAAHLNEAKLSDADLEHASFNGANLERADLRKARLNNANLRGAVLINTLLEGADLTNCDVFGISAWDVNLSGAIENNLRITDTYNAEITVNSLEVSQFLYLILNNDKIKQVLDSATSKIVLLLGRFTEDRMIVLNGLKEALAKINYIPVIFNFDRPESQTYTETITTLARMSGFIIADLTDPASIPKELEAIVPHVMVPVKPIIEGKKRTFSMVADLATNNEDRFLMPYRYTDLTDLENNLEKEIIIPCERTRQALIQKRKEVLEKWNNA